MSGGNRIGNSGSGNVNAIAAFIGILSIPCIYKVIYEKEKKYLFIYGVQVIFMLLTGSKKGLIFILLGITILIVFKYGVKVYRYLLPIIILSLALFILFKIKYFYNIIGYRIETFFFIIFGSGSDSLDAKSTDERLLMIRTALKAFIESPFLGKGWYFFSSYSGFGTYSHNNYTEILVSYGILGFSIYYSYFAKIIKDLYKIVKSNNYAKMYISIIFSILAADIATVSFGTIPQNYIVLFFSFLLIQECRTK
jgi:O-antigen ligase